MSLKIKKDNHFICESHNLATGCIARALGIPFFTMYAESCIFLLISVYLASSKKFYINTKNYLIRVSFSEG